MILPTLKGLGSPQTKYVMLTTRLVQISTILIVMVIIFWKNTTSTYNESLKRNLF